MSQWYILESVGDKKIVSNKCDDYAGFLYDPITKQIIMKGNEYVLYLYVKFKGKSQYQWVNADELQVSKINVGGEKV